MFVEMVQKTFSASAELNIFYFLLLLIDAISFTYLKQCGAKPTPKPRATMFSALSYYPNSHVGESL
jgi:hypothetical protein